MNGHKKTRFLTSLFYTLLSLALILLLWFLASISIKSELVMPSPKSVLESLAVLLESSRFYSQIGMTTLRSIEAFVISFSMAIVLGFAIGTSSKVERLLALPFGIVKVAPVVSFILPAVFWFSTDRVPIFVSVLMTLPLMTTNISCGIKSINSSFLTLSKIFNLTAFQKFRYIYLNSIKSYLASGASSAFSMSWKVVVASEVLSLPRLASGTELYSAKVNLDTAQVFAISISVIVLSFVLERFFYGLIRLARFTERKKQERKGKENDQAFFRYKKIRRSKHI